MSMMNIEERQQKRQLLLALLVDLSNKSFTQGSHIGMLEAKGIPTMVAKMAGFIKDPDEAYKLDIVEAKAKLHDMLNMTEEAKAALQAEIGDAGEVDMDSGIESTFMPWVDEIMDMMVPDSDRVDALFDDLPQSY